MKSIIILMFGILVNFNVCMAKSCEFSVEAAKLVFETNDFYLSSLKAIQNCSAEAKIKKMDEVQSILLDSKSLCDKTSDQLSELYTGTCYLKAAEYAQFILTHIVRP